MFYGETEIQELVICPYCKNKYHDPRIIECGTSFCMPCIEFLTKSDTNGFQCPVCDEFHEQPKKGYPKNTNLAKLCDKRANKVSRSPLADALNTQLDELKQSMDKLAHENDLSEDKIKEYCDGLRNEVQLHLEELIESLKKQTLELIQKIDKYENETKLKFDAKHCLRLDAFLSETRRFHEKWDNYLKQFKINDEELKLASLEAKRLQNKLNKDSELFLSKVFHFKLLKFKKSTPCVGSLIDEGVKEIYIQALNSLKPFKCKVKKENLVLKLLSNGNLCTANRNNNEKMVNLAVLDKDLNQLVKKHCEISEGYRGFQVVELNKTIVLCLFDPEANASNISPSRIIEFDNGLDFISSFGVNFEISYADTHEDKLYLLATRPDRNSKHIYVYDKSLKFLDNIQLGNGEGLPICVPDSANKMRVADNFFIFLDGTKVLLMNRDDGMIKQTFCIGSSDFVLDSSNDRIIAHDDELERLVCFDFEGESFEMPISKLKNVELISYANERFMFYDANSICLYF